MRFFSILFLGSAVLASCHSTEFNRSMEEVQRILEDARRDDVDAAIGEFDPTSQRLTKYGRKYVTDLCDYLRHNYEASFIVIDDFSTNAMDGKPMQVLRIANEKGERMVNFELVFSHDRWRLATYTIREYQDDLIFLKGPPNPFPHASSHMR